MKDPDSVSIGTRAGEKKKPRYDDSMLSKSPEPGTPVKDSGSPNPIVTPDDTPVRNETSGLVSRSTNRNLMDDFKEIDELKRELEELREKLTQCQTDLEESKFSNKLKKLVSCRRAGLKPKKSRRKKKTKKPKKTKPRRKRKQTKKR